MSTGTPKTRTDPLFRGPVWLNFKIRILKSLWSKKKKRKKIYTAPAALCHYLASDTINLTCSIFYLDNSWLVTHLTFLFARFFSFKSRIPVVKDDQSLFEFDKGLFDNFETNLKRKASKLIKFVTVTFVASELNQWG